MSPKVLSIFNNAKIFLSEQEMKELASCIEKDFGRVAHTKATPKQRTSRELQNYTLERVTEKLLATTFRKKTPPASR